MEQNKQHKTTKQYTTKQDRIQHKKWNRKKQFQVMKQNRPEWIKTEHNIRKKEKLNIIGQNISLYNVMTKTKFAS